MKGQDQEGMAFVESVNYKEMLGLFQELGVWGFGLFHLVLS